MSLSGSLFSYLALGVHWGPNFPTLPSSAPSPPFILATSANSMSKSSRGKESVYLNLPGNPIGLIEGICVQFWTVQNMISRLRYDLEPQRYEKLHGVGYTLPQ